MEEKKYYTPTIEEFQPGLDYEMFNFDTNEYLKCIMSFEDFYYPVVINQIRSGHCRVKHLNKEDIESLGWKKVSDTTHSIYINEHTFYISRFSSPEREHEFLIQYGHGERPGMFTHVVFRGTIKNKSRLCLVMQMVGII